MPESAGDGSPDIEETFASYLNTGDYLGGTHGIYKSGTAFDRNTSHITLDQSADAAIPSIGQVQCEKVSWPNNAPADYEIGRTINFGRVTKEFWLEIYLKFSPSFTTQGPQTANEDYKTLQAHIKESGEGHGNWRIKHRQAKIETGPEESNPSNTDYYDTGEDCVSEQDSPGQGRYWDGRWYRYRQHCKMESAPGANDGIIELYIKPEHGPEALYVRQTTLNTADGLEGFDWLYRGANMNRGTSRTMEMWWGRTRIWFTDPNWSVAQWEVFEVPLLASGVYSNPYTSASGTITFTGPSSQTITMPLFWREGSRWCGRGSFNEDGTWTWLTSSADSGLNGKSGSVLVGGDPLPAPIRVSQTYPRHWERRGGDPILFLTDTNWDFFHLTTQWPDEVQNYVDNRSAKRFSVIQTTFIPSGDGTHVRDLGENEGGTVFTSLGSQVLNPNYFLYCDRRMEYVRQFTDMTVMVNIMWSDDWASFDTTSYNRFARMLLARYGAYPVIFGIMGEYEEVLTASQANTLGNALDALDPYPGRLTCHAADHTDALSNAWLDFHQKQRKSNSHADINGDAISLRADGIPVLIAETNYEEQNSATGTTLKQLAGAAFAGGAGFSYGHNDVTTHDAPWEEDLDDVGAAAMKHFRDFFEPEGGTRIPWEAMTPDNALVTSGTAYLLRETNVRYIAFLPSGGTININLGGASGSFTYNWFSADDGSTAVGGSTTGGGTRSFSAPNSNRWILHIRR